jgi:hypothetical protein
MRFALKSIRVAIRGIWQLPEFHVGREYGGGLPVVVQSRSDGEGSFE